MQPQWIKDYKAGKLSPQNGAGNGNQVKEQFTVLRRTPQQARPVVKPMALSGQGANFGSLQRPEISEQPMRMPQPMTSRLTGAGVDGQVQPTKMTGQVHEGEGVLNTNAMQNLTPDEFKAFSNALETGKLDKNTFLKSIGLPPVAGFSVGGIVDFNDTSGADSGPSDSGGAASDSVTIPSPQGRSMAEGRERTNPNPPPIKVDPIQQRSPIKPMTIETAPVQQSVQPPMQTNMVQPVSPKPMAFSTQAQEPSTLNASPIVQRNEADRTTPVSAPVAPMTIETAPVQTPQTITATPIQSVQPKVIQPLSNEKAQIVPSYQRSAAEAQTIYDNSQLQRSGAAQAAAQAAAGQELNQAGVSAAGKATQSAELARTQSASMDNLRTDLAKQHTSNLGTFSNIDLNQRDQKLQEDQQSINNQRYDTEKTEENKRYYDTQTYNRAQTADQTAYNRAKDAKEQERLDKLNISADKATYQKDMEDRLGILFNGGTTLAQMQGDRMLQDQVKQYLGPNATPEDIASQINIMFNSATENNRESFTGNAEKYIGDAIDNKKTLEQVLNDQNIRRQVAGYLGANTTDEQINREISSRYNEINKSDSQRIFENFSENWVSEDIKKVPGWDTDLKQTISDLYMKGVVDADGNIKAGAVFDWPWEDPDTMFKYQDWNGNSVSGGTYDQTAAINVDGNGKTFVNAEGKAVTMADANKVWNGLSSSDRSSYMTGGKMDTAKFMAKHFPTTKDTAGNTVSLMTRDNFTNKVISDPDYLNNVNDVLAEFTSGGKIPGEKGKDPYAGEPIPEGQYIYYDENGAPKVSGKADANKLAFIYQQLSDKYNSGNTMTAGQFSEYWGDGKKWRIGEDGTILNISTPGQDVKATELPGVKTLENWDMYSTSALGENTVSSLAKLSKEERTANKSFAAIPDSFGEYFLDELEGNSVFTDNKKKRFSNSGAEWLNANIGKLYKSSNGKVYQILGENGDSGEAHVLLRDMTNNDVVKHNLKTNDNYNVMGNLSSGQYGNLMSTLKSKSTATKLTTPTPISDPVVIEESSTAGDSTGDTPSDTPNDNTDDPSGGWGDGTNTDSGTVDSESGYA